ncbi:hypothetical protein [Sphingomonas quercus]|uniref:Uncharacterized protein n=1 Tax=Sphingomonas quercus TaxID=2842451 RepID=A0ABS6BMC4_9SPHN|nr:hypothetical protein [Sphingomonas quercus]MBU3078987.1 hypothetical protein [Sphingomonas quercus]
MDIGQFADHEARLSAQLTEALKGGKTDAVAALGKPAELQRQQIDRVAERIKALEEEKIAAAARIDAEIAELKGELDQRTRTLDAAQETTKPAKPDRRGR